MTEAFREYIYEPRRLVKQYRRTLEQRLKLWANCTKTTATLGGIAGGTGGGGAKDGANAALADLNAKLVQLADDYKAASDEMLLFLSVVRRDPGNEHGKRDAEILKLRYAARLGWGTVLKKLNDEGYHCQSLRTVYKWHADALARSERKWEEIYGKPDKNTGG